MPEDTGPAEVDAPSQRRRGLGLRNRQRKVDQMEAQDWAMRVTWKNPNYRLNIAIELQNNTLNPMLTKAIWDMTGAIPKGSKGELLADAVRGLTMLLRKPLSEDPLARAKPIEVKATVVDQPAETEALVPRPSIVPPARPRRTQGKATLRPGEEELQ
jgi:hypothetical protein